MENKIELLNFIDISSEEKQMVLAWRNHQEIRKWMYNKNEITLKEHLKYIESLSMKKDRIYFLVKELNEYLGVIDFTSIVKNEYAEFGLYAKPNLIGIGTTLMSTIIEYAFTILKLQKLLANVHVNNTKAIKLYKRFHFIEIKKERDTSGEYIQMELKYEDR